MSGPRHVQIDLGTPLVDISMQVSANRLNEAVRVVVAQLNNHETQIHNLLGRVGDIEKRQELQQRELNRIAPAAGASSAELLEQILALKRDVSSLASTTGDATRELEAALGGRVSAAEEAIKAGAEARTRDLISREKDFTQLTADMQKLATRLGGLVIPDVAPLESAQRSLTRRLDEAEKLLVFASSFAAVWDADAARVEATSRAATAEKIEYVHSLPAMRALRTQMLQELRVQAVERLDMLTHELRDKVDLHKLTDLLAAVDEQLNELRVEDGRQERRLVALEQGPLRISSIEDNLRRLQQSKADVSSLDLKADLAALQGLVNSINTIQDDINDLYDRVPKGSHSGGGGAGGVSSPKGKYGSSGVGTGGGDASFNDRSTRPSHVSIVPSLPSGGAAASQIGGKAGGGSAAVDSAALQALERRVGDAELQAKRLDDLKANRSELLRLHEYLDSKLQNFSALTSSAVAQANAAANAASKTLAAAAASGIGGGGGGAGGNGGAADGGGNNAFGANSGRPGGRNNNNGGDGSINGGGGGGDAAFAASNRPLNGGDNNAGGGAGAGGLQSPRPPAGSGGAPTGPIVTGRGGLGARQPHPPGVGSSNVGGLGGAGVHSARRVSPGRGGGFNTSAFQMQQQQFMMQVQQSPNQHRRNQGLNVDGQSSFIGGDANGALATTTSPGVSPQRRSPLPTAQIGNSWHIGRASIAVRDSAGHFCGSATLVPRHEASPVPMVVYDEQGGPHSIDSPMMPKRRVSPQQQQQSPPKQSTAAAPVTTGDSVDPTVE